MSIHPVYALRIMSGDKRVEFRKRSLASDVSRVAVYATAPIQRVVGTFEIAETVVSSPAAIWRRFRDFGGITKADFDEYYDGCSEAVALVVGHVTDFGFGLRLDQVREGLTAPQSFLYLSDTAASKVQDPAPVLAALA